MVWMQKYWYVSRGSQIKLLYGLDPSRDADGTLQLGPYRVWHTGPRYKDGRDPKILIEVVKSNCFMVLIPREMSANSGGFYKWSNCDPHILISYWWGVLLTFPCRLWTVLFICLVSLARQSFHKIRQSIRNPIRHLIRNQIAFSQPFVRKGTKNKTVYFKKFSSRNFQKQV